jgi:capsular polysaccharide biosynthesis protein
VIEITVKTLADIAGASCSPFSMHPPGMCGYSIVKPRFYQAIPPPSVQSGSIDCPPVDEFSMPEVSVAYLRDAIVTRTGAVIAGDRYLVEETLEGDLEFNGFVEESGKIYYDAGACEYHNGTLVDFCKFGVFNYSIFLAEVSAPAAVLSFLPDVYAHPYYMHFPEFMSDQAIANRDLIMSALGFGHDRRVETDAVGIRASGVVIAKVNDRYLNHRVSQALPIVSGVLRNRFATRTGEQPRRFYIHRQGQVARTVENFDELEPVLARYGVEPVALDELGFEEQVNLFSKADLVIAEHGAGLANSIFMRPGATVVELFPAPMVGRWMYRGMASAFHLNYCFAAFPVAPTWAWDRDQITVPIDPIRQILGFVSRQ